MRKLSFKYTFKFGPHNIKTLTQNAQTVYSSMSADDKQSWNEATHFNAFAKADPKQAFCAFVIAKFISSNSKHYNKKVTSFLIQNASSFNERKSISVTAT